MGSLMPSGAGVRCSWVAVFNSVLMIALSCLAFSNPGSFESGSAQIDQLGQTLPGLAVRCVAVFRHLCNLDAFQHFLDALVYLAQGLADRAALGLVAFSAYGDACGDEQGAVDRPDYLVRRNLARIPGQLVTTIHSSLRVQQSGPGQPLQDLG